MTYSRSCHNHRARKRLVTSETVCEALPVAWIFLIFFSDEYQMRRLSGHQKGESSAAVKSWDSPDSRKCTHRRSRATKASLRPSGESLRDGASVVFSGAGIWKRTVVAGAGGFSRKCRNATGARPADSTAAKR